MSSSSTVIQYADRSVAIITLGILSCLFLGPIAGIPGWLIANQDLRDIRAGFLAATSASPVTLGKWLSIIGTFFSPIWLFVYAILVFVTVTVIGALLGAAGACCWSLS